MPNTVESVISDKATFFSSLKLVLKGEHIDHSKGDLRTSLLLLSIPMVLEMLMESLFSVADIFFVSKLGTDAVAAVGLTESLMSVIYSISLGIGMAATALIARRVGEKKFNKAGDAAFQVICVGMLFAVLTGLPGFIFSDSLLSMMGASEAVIASGATYTRIIFAGNVTIMLLFLINGIFRGAGNASHAMHALWIGNGINMVLDPILIFGMGPIPAMGLEGAAYATVISRSIGVVYQVIILMNNPVVRITLENLIIKKRLMIKIIKLSIGGMSQFIIESLSWLLLIFFVAEFGSNVVAGFTIANRILLLILLPAWGIANASATLVGQNLGASKTARAEASVWLSTKYNMLLLGLVSLIFLLAPEYLAHWFTDDEEVIFQASEAIRIFAYGFIFFAAGMVINQSFNGAGDTRTPMIINTVSFIIFQIPLAVLLAFTFDMGAVGIYWSIAISYAFQAIASWFIFRKGEWKLVHV